MVRFPLLPVLSLVALTALGCKPDYVFPPVPDKPDHANPPPVQNPLQVDRIVQVVQPEVDVLFVVDNSCSMYEEQVALANNFPAFMEYFTGSGIDFHLGVTSTDLDSSGSAAGIKGTLKSAAGHRFIDQHTANPVGVFGTMTNLGTNGWYDEKGRKAAYTTIELKRDVPANQGFYRDDAALHFVFVSDEEDASNGTPTRPEFIEWMRNLKWSPESTTAHGIYKIPGTTCNTADTYGTHYDAYVNQTGGIKQSICAPNWNPFLDALGLETSGLKREFFLTRIPVPSTIVLEVFNGVVTKGYDVCFGDQVGGDGCEAEYDRSRNSVKILDPANTPDPLAVITIEYNVLEDYSAAVDTVGGDTE